MMPWKLTKQPNKSLITGNMTFSKLNTWPIRTTSTVTSVIIFLVGLSGMFGVIATNSQEPNQTQPSVQNIDQPNKSETRTLKVGIKSAPPMVILGDGKIEGFSIELWNQIAKRSGFATEFIVKENVKDLLESVINKENNLAIAAISQTPDREKIVDFSQPYMDAGLEILLKSDQQTIVEKLLIFLKSGAMRFIYFGLLVIIIIANLHYFYKLWRGLHTSKNYIHNIWDSIWWLFNGFFRTDFGDQNNRIHQFISCFMIILSVIFVTQFQALVTSDLTLDKLESKVSSLDDIRSRQVGVVKNTTANKYAGNNNLNITVFDNNDQMLESLISDKIGVVIMDVPMAKYFANNQAKGKVVESIALNNEHYSIAFPIGSDLRKEVNSAILELEQDGTMKELQKKWFGE
jgi:polar amino acid transport system substrate-binding protein